MISEKTAAIGTGDTAIRHDWQIDEVVDLLSAPISDLLFSAQAIHRQYFDPNPIQLSTLVNIKTGGCPEDCAYCPQSARYHTGVSAAPMMSVNAVRKSAERARANGAGRFCMGAAWRQPRDRDIETVVDMIKSVKETGLESCATLGMLTRKQARRLQRAGLDFYNHNLDSSASFYKKIISTREYQDRLTTLSHVRAAGIKVCCGGIIGMGERVSDRAELLLTLANMARHPESVPINYLVKIAGTPLEAVAEIDPFDFIRTIAAARIMMPKSRVRLAAGRDQMNEQMQVLCFLAGANSIFYGDKLLTAKNPEIRRDRALLRRLGIKSA